MGSAVRDIYIQATAEEVWDYFCAPGNIVEWWPRCEAIPGDRLQSDGRFAFTWTDKPGAPLLHEEIEETLVVPGEGITLHLAGDICGDLRWRVQTENGGTHVTFESDYALPVRSLITHLSPVRLWSFEEHEADAIAASVRRHFSSGSEPLVSTPRAATRRSGDRRGAVLQRLSHAAK